jgi:uncharacterized protein YndB with AHSA1/START domain
MSLPTELPFCVERDVVIAARRATVYRYFTDSERWAAWWGPGSHIDPRPGGALLIRYPGGSATASGHVVELVPGERIVFTFGFDYPDAPIAPGGSRVTVTLSEVPGGIRVQLRHDVADERTRDGNAAGWRYHMAVFAHVVADDQHAGAAAIIDGYLAAWSEPDAASRRAALAATCAAAITYRDRYGVATGLADLDGHIAAAQIHLPSRLEREGDVRQAEGVAIVDWLARRDGGAVAARGTSVLDLDGDGRIARVTGFWRDAPAP